jgi:tetratricopeptide (TPR) repeat protein
VHTRERTPAQWVRSSNNLAITLKKLADETSDPAPLRRAVDLYRDVVATTSRESLPLDWADYQQNLGNALAALADYEDAGPNLDAALAAYQAAGEITTVARGAGKWQGLQTAIATTLLMKGLKTMDRAPVLEAQQLTLAARDKMRELGAPDEEFYTQYLGAVDKVLAILPK